MYGFFNNDLAKKRQVSHNAGLGSRWYGLGLGAICGLLLAIGIAGCREKAPTNVQSTPNLGALSTQAEPQAPPPTPSSDSLATVAVQRLPVEGRNVLHLIYQGGPFRYDRDGVVFGNRERLLPKAPRGFYREYTVPTLGARNRGIRRIVCGGEIPTQPQACYYTEDHYSSFQKIVP